MKEWRRKLKIKTIMHTMKGECYLCGKQGYTHLHHIFDGPNRKWSTKYGLVVYLCVDCHNVPPNGVHHNIQRMRSLQAAGQKQFEKQTGSRELFMQIFGRNYIDDEGRTG